MQTAWLYHIGKYRNRCIQIYFPFASFCMQTAWLYHIGKYRNRCIQIYFPFASDLLLTLTLVT